MRKLVALLVLATAALVAQSTTRLVQLSWTASTTNGVTGYNIFRGPTASGPFTQLNTTPITGTSFNDTTAVVGQTYTYQVDAVAAACTPTTPVTTACGSSVPAVTATNVPPQPAVTGTVTTIVP